MEIREIPRESWNEFLDGFSLRHEGWLVDVETLGPAGPRTRARQLPLQKIARSPGGDCIAICLGPDVALEHDVRRPRHIDVEEEGGAERALRIRSESGEATRVSFRAAVPPESVDGILPG